MQPRVATAHRKKWSIDSVVYEVLFVVGIFGFLAMGFLGGRHSRAARGGHHGHAPGHGHSHGHHGPVKGVLKHPHGLSWLIPSPLDVFAVALACGGVGMLVEKWPLALSLPLALGAGLVFNYGIVKPLMNFLFRFASDGSEGLEGSIASAAQAVTAFDPTGKGLVTLVLDGQNVQLLARLEADDVRQSLSVRKGDTVIVTQVDPKSGTCVVTRSLTE